MRAKFGSDPTAGSKIWSFKFISRYIFCLVPRFSVHENLLIYCDVCEVILPLTLTTFAKLILLE